MDIIEEIKKFYNGIEVELVSDFLLVQHPKYKFEIEFDREEDDWKRLLSIVKETLEAEYELGKSFLDKDYYEILVNISYGKNLFPEENIDIPVMGSHEGKCFYEIGEVSNLFGQFLKETITYDHFDVDYCTSLKIHHLETVTGLKDKKALKKVYESALNTIMFDLHRNYSLKLSIVDYGNEEEHDIDFYEEPEIDQVEDTTFDLNIYDNDLLSYYNRAANMDDSEFKYLAYFQVLECIFDEVYKEETIQDVRGILQSSGFSNRKNEDIYKIVEIVERYRQEKNDRSKTGLVLDKYFKGNLRKEAYDSVNEGIFQLLKDIGHAKDINEIKDMNKLANIIYDFRCKCTHSNRSYPIKSSTVLSNEYLTEYIRLIQKVAERIILNYKNT